MDWHHGDANPYLAARREWNERYGDYIAQARNWRVAAVLALCIALISAGGLTYVASQSQIVPYIVRVDKLGSAAAVDRADRPFKPDNQLIVASLARFVANIRSVYTDAGAERVLLKEAYAMINERGDGYAKLNEHMRAHDPFERAKTETVTVEVESVLPLSADSWRIEWREETRARDGSKPVRLQWQANVSISISPPSDEAAIRLNPLGIYINSFNWSQRL
ncbi:MAG: conjugal transfer protein [Rhodomicrobium sp.]|nr:conjugal transfer protein [Rhodomicrobium sp.]